MPIDISGKAFDKKNVKEKQEEITKNMQQDYFLANPRYKFEDIILDDITKDMLYDAISIYTNREKLFQEWGLEKKYRDKSNLTINMYGDSGTGKTMAAHAIAYELKKKIMIVDYAQIESKYVGETSKNIKKMFCDAQENDAILVFDEADAMLSKRVTDMRSSTDVSVNQTRSVLLNILNDYQGIVIFTTNFIQNFDPAFLRRIRYHIRFGYPNEKLRHRLWTMYIPDELPVSFDISELAHNVQNVSASDISNAVFNAAVSAARNGKAVLDYNDFEMAISSIVAARKENNESQNYTVTKRKVSEEYVKNTLSGN